MNIRFATTSRAAIITANNDAGDQQAVAAIATVLEDVDSPVRLQAVAVREAAESFASTASSIITTYSIAARSTQLRTVAVRTLAGPTQRMIAAGQAEARAIAAAWTRLTSVPPADATTAGLRQHDRTEFTRLAIGDKAAWIEQGDVDQLGAVIEAGSARFSDVTAPIWDRLEERYAALNFIRMAGTAADFARKPTVDDPIATGVDMDAAERAAAKGLERHHERSEITEAVEQSVRGITTIVALTCELDMVSAFALITEKVPA
ncbi:hypothetical protein HMP09_2323 [Sphingomonas sp. HMP9]|uniref:hypothetical protein n=1 Tax=Sphingomonas sp. HMP9 TaxID=1517554 RepID=UPI001596CD12|nr:hypothetical protein [Sphingomonas sp. HMP9]BCA63089.1 hypothetical protein HMP09_2323 [Sphingomonas sp. HMP9]